jgi:hypothetical protein
MVAVRSVDRVLVERRVTAATASAVEQTLGTRVVLLSNVAAGLRVVADVA